MRLLSSPSLRGVVAGSSLSVGLCLGVAVPLAYAAGGGAGAASIAAACLLLGGAIGWAVYRLAMTRIDCLIAEQGAATLRFHTAIDNITQGVCFFDGERRLIVCNRRYAAMYGLPDELMRRGTTLEAIVAHRFTTGNCPDMSPAEYLVWRNSIATNNAASDTVTTLRDGRAYAIHHQPMPDGGWVATHADITESRRAIALIERMVHHDSLTELPNRVLFRERLVGAVKRRRGTESVAVLYIDLDRFKAVNDTLGHPAGDLLLRLAAQRLSDCVRQGDLVARLGGDEFAIIQTSATQPAASQALADRLVRVIAEPFDIGGHPVHVGASVGVALSPDDASDPDELLKKADVALYDAKAAGRGRSSFFGKAMAVSGSD